MHRLVMKLTELILSTFLSKNSSTRFFTKKLFESIISTYTAVTSFKKPEKFHALVLPHFGSILGPFWTKKLQNKVVPKNIVCLSQF